MSDLLDQTVASNLKGVKSCITSPSTPSTTSRSDGNDTGATAASLASPGAARRAADGHPRHHRREHRAAAHRDGSEDERLDDQLDDHELLADLRKPAALRRPRRRPARPPPDVPDRPRRLHRLLVRLGDGRKRAMLFASRAGQGLGAAILSPAALSIITSAFHGAARGKALAAWGAVGGAGAAIGVLVGGVLTSSPTGGRSSTSTSPSPQRCSSPR